MLHPHRPLAGGPTQSRYSAIVLYREAISDQIVGSVYNSRKTIIVLSQSYIESQWSDMEFKAAHKKALIDKIQV